MNIHQLSVSYVQEQDRCLVRINSHDHKELRLWFTRRLTLALMPYLAHIASEQLKVHTAPTASVPMDALREQMLERFQKEADAYGGDFKTPFETEEAELPLGAAPVLITEIKLSLQTSGTVELQLIETSLEESRNIQLAMNPQLVQGLLHLLDEALKKSQWLEATPLRDRMVGQPNTESLSQSDLTVRPKYLN